MEEYYYISAGISYRYKNQDQNNYINEYYYDSTLANAIEQFLKMIGDTYKDTVYDIIELHVLHMYIAR